MAIREPTLLTVLRGEHARVAWLVTGSVTSGILRSAGVVWSIAHVTPALPDRETPQEPTSPTGVDVLA